VRTLEIQDDREIVRRKGAAGCPSGTTDQNHYAGQSAFLISHRETEANVSFSVSLCEFVAFVNGVIRKCVGVPVSDPIFRDAETAGMA
jgi:hypothetical protein